MRARRTCREALAAVTAGVLACAQILPAAPPANTGVLTRAAGAAGPPQAPREDAGFAQALKPRPMVFPRDHGPHPDYRQEWWYLTGNLDAASGERFGFELTFFRFALAPAPAPPVTAVADSAGPAARSAWRTREIYMADFAVTDVARRRFRFARKLSREALGLAGSQPEPLRVWIDDWLLTATAADTRWQWQLHAAQPGYELDLALEPEITPVLNGDAGLSRKSAQASSASYYYSIPRVRVRGRLLREGRPLEVSGLAWLDREWGSGELGPREVGWDWFGLQLGDGSSLMFYALRDRDGRRDPFSAGTWVTPSGEARSLASDQVAIAVTDYWRNPEGLRYPAAWRIRVPSLALALEVRPVLADQELRTAPRYWEGAVDVSGARAGGSLGGRGYVELVGYAPPERSPAEPTGAAAHLVR